jgi:hypothetical protein
MSEKPPPVALDADLKAELLRNVTVSVVTAGRAFGLKRNASYQAAQDGRLPTVQVGKRKKAVPTAPLCKLLGFEKDATG